eukprot:3941285-Rhodomonas_salina.1
MTFSTISLSSTPICAGIELFERAWEATGDTQTTGIRGLVPMSAAEIEEKGGGKEGRRRDAEGGASREEAGERERSERERREKRERKERAREGWRGWLWSRVPMPVRPRAAAPSAARLNQVMGLFKQGGSEGGMHGWMEEGGR